MLAKCEIDQFKISCHGHQALAYDFLQEFQARPRCRASNGGLQLVGEARRRRVAQEPVPSLGRGLRGNGAAGTEQTSAQVKFYGAAILFVVLVTLVLWTEMPLNYCWPVLDYSATGTKIVAKRFVKINYQIFW